MAASCNPRRPDQPKSLTPSRPGSPTPSIPKTRSRTVCRRAPGVIRDAVQDAVDVDALQPDGQQRVGVVAGELHGAEPGGPGAHHPQHLQPAFDLPPVGEALVLSWPGTMERMKPVFSATTLRAVRSRSASTCGSSAPSTSVLAIRSSRRTACVAGGV